MSSSSTTVPGADHNGMAIVPVEKIEELDDETALQLVRSMRRIGIGLGIGAIAPFVLSMVLLQYAPFDVPVVAAFVALAFGFIGTPSVIIHGQRRAFVAECRSLGISTTLAQKLYLRYMLGEFALDMRLQRITLDDIDRAAVRRLLRP